MSRYEHEVAMGFDAAPLEIAVNALRGIIEENAEGEFQARRQFDLPPSILVGRACQAILVLCSVQAVLGLRARAAQPEWDDVAEVLRYLARTDMAPAYDPAVSVREVPLEVVQGQHTDEGRFAAAALLCRLRNRSGKEGVVYQGLVNVLKDDGHSQMGSPRLRAFCDALQQALLRGGSE